MGTRPASPQLHRVFLPCLCNRVSSFFFFFFFNPKTGFNRVGFYWKTRIWPEVFFLKNPKNPKKKKPKPSSLSSRSRLLRSPSAFSPHQTISQCSISWLCILAMAFRWSRYVGMQVVVLLDLTRMAMTACSGEGWGVVWVRCGFDGGDGNDDVLCYFGGWDFGFTTSFSFSDCVTHVERKRHRKSPKSTWANLNELNGPVRNSNNPNVKIAIFSMMGLLLFKTRIPWRVGLNGYPLKQAGWDGKRVFWNGYLIKVGRAGRNPTHTATLPSLLIPCQLKFEFVMFHKLVVSNQNEL